MLRSSAALASLGARFRFRAPVNSTSTSKTHSLRIAVHKCNKTIVAAQFRSLTDAQTWRPIPFAAASASSSSEPLVPHREASFAIQATRAWTPRQAKRALKRGRSLFRICSSRGLLFSRRELARLYTTQNEKSESLPESTNSQRSEKYSEFLRRRLGVWKQTFRRFFGAGQPFTLDRFLPVFNLMFVAIAVTVLIGTTSIISLIVWVVNRNERWRGSWTSENLNF